MTINIIGAGMAGLLAGNMLNRHDIVIHEAQPSLPNNHSAVLRFGTEKVSEVLGIPFRKVRMIKTYVPWRNRVADCLSYSMKCTGIARSDRSITSDVFSADRWIAPPDLVIQMSDRISTGRIKFDYKVNFEKNEFNEVIISTIPMPALMKLLDYPHQPEFKWVGGKNLRCKIEHCDAFVSMYVPNPVHAFNRIRITGNELIAEYSGAGANGIVASSDLVQISEILGIPHHLFGAATVKDQTYAKIAPIDDGERKRFLAWATDQHNIYSLGRFATWRPGLMLDDLVHDIRLIERWATKDKYGIRMHR